jgi:hypothetical protein
MTLSALLQNFDMMRLAELKHVTRFDLLRVFRACSMQQPWRWMQAKR